MEERPYRGSELFTVRVWVENIGPPQQQQLEWRGKLCHVAHDSTRHFRGWPAMVELLQTLAADLTHNADEAGGTRGEDRGQGEEQVAE